MPVSFSPTATADANASQSEEVWLVLLTLSHPEINPPIRVVNNIEPITSRGHEFLGFPFDLQLISQGGDAPSEARLSIDNVQLAFVEGIRMISTPPKVVAEIILASDPDFVEFQTPEMTMRGVSYNANEISGTLALEDLTIEPIAETILPYRFPGLF